MNIATKALLISLYPLLLLARLANLVLHSDHLRLHDLRCGESCWIERRASPTPQSYFSEELWDVSRKTSAARPLSWFLRNIARLYAPRRRALEQIYRAAAEREKGIPDEVYTLW
jgi:hypothetical protein